MTFVVTENCIKCKYTDCVEVCPVDCFHEGPNCLVIDPEECIDCTLCEPECPAEAIFAEDDVPESQRAFTALNAELAQSWPVINRKKDPPPDADEWMASLTNLNSWSAETRSVRLRAGCAGSPPGHDPGGPQRPAAAPFTGFLR